MDDEQLRADIQGICESILDSNDISERGLDIVESIYSQICEGKTPSDRQVDVIDKISAGIWYAGVCSSREDREGYIYFAVDTSDLNNIYLKIGFSKDPEKRVKSMKTARPMIRLRYKKRGSRRVEDTLHRLNDFRRVGGEWFVIDSNIHADLENWADSQIKRAVYILEKKKEAV